MGGGGNIETEKGFVQLLARLKLNSEHIANLINSQPVKTGIA